MGCKSFIFLLIVIFIFNIYLASFVSGQSSGLVAYYPFNGNVNDESGNNNNGIIIGSGPGQVIPTNDRYGNNFNAYDFSGTVNNYISIADSPSISLKNAFTISGWFYFRSDGSINDIGNVRLIAKEQSSTNWEYRLLTLDGGTFGFNDALLMQLSANGLDNSLSVQINNALSGLGDGGEALYKNKWVHIASTYDGTTLKLYINNVLIGSSIGSITIADSNTNPPNLGIGADGGGNYPFKGKIDNVRIYNKALSNSNLSKLYSGVINYEGLPDTFSPTLAYLHQFGSSIVSLWDNKILYLSKDGTYFKLVDETALNNMGFPNGYIPKVAIYYQNISNSLNEKRIILYNKNNQGFYFSIDGQNFFPNPALPSSSSGNYHIISPFSTGYYHGFIGGIVALTNKTNAYELIYDIVNGQAPVPNPPSTSFINENSIINNDEATSMGLPGGYPPKVGYYYRFSNCPYLGPIGDTNGDGSVRADDVAKVQSLIGTVQTSLNYDACADIDGNGNIDNNDYSMINQPPNIDGRISPIVTSLNAGVHRWYMINGSFSVYSWTGTGNFIEIKNKITGLPIVDIGAPDAGYYDKFLNRIVLWYGCDAYASENGINFNLIKDGIIDCSWGGDGDRDTVNDISDICPAVVNDNPTDSNSNNIYDICDSSFFNNLPGDFIPIVGYTHTLGGRGIQTTILVNSNGDSYVASTKNPNFRLVTDEEKTSQNALGFKTIAAYQHNFKGPNDGLVSIWDASGNAKIWARGDGGFREITNQEKIDLGLNGFIPVFGRTNNIMGPNNQGIELTDNNGNTKLIIQGVNNNFRDLTTIEKNSQGLKGLKPIEGYYMDNINKLFFWNLDGKMYIWDSAQTKFIQQNPTNLPSVAPNAAYYDKFLQRSFVWFGCSIYSSSDGINFIRIRKGPESCSIITGLLEPICARFDKDIDCNDKRLWDDELKSIIQEIHKPFADANKLDYDFCTNPDSGVECGCYWTPGKCIEKIDPTPTINIEDICFTPIITLEGSCGAGGEYKLKWTSSYGTTTTEDIIKGCINGEKSFSCPSVVKIPFFGIGSFFVSILLIFLVYIILILKRGNK